MRIAEAELPYQASPIRARRAGVIAGQFTQSGEDRVALRVICRIGNGFTAFMDTHFLRSQIPSTDQVIESLKGRPRLGVPHRFQHGEILAEVGYVRANCRTSYTLVDVRQCFPR